jgi:ATP-binding cassette subfamily F protein 3
MLSVNGVSKALGDHLVLDRVSFSINPGDRIGLVGPNGAGKSTLLAVVAGTLSPDCGSVFVQPGTHIGYLRQGFAEIERGTLETLLDLPLSGLLAAERDHDDASHALATGPATEARLVAYSFAVDELEAKGGHAKLAALSNLLDRFGLGGRDHSTPLDRMSGGEKTRAGLAAILTSTPDVLLLDEPTNHLDIDALGWLETFLLTYRGAMLIVSHDRAFLDRVATDVLALDDGTHTASRYPGNYSDYLVQREREETAHLDAFTRQQREIGRIERDVRAVASHGQSTERETTNDYVRGRAKKVARTAKVRERKLERLLASEERLDKPERRWGLALDFALDGDTGRDVVSLHKLTVRFGERAILDEVDLQIRSKDRVALTGPNGAGKSTLINVVCGRLCPDAGTVTLGTGVKIGLYTQEQELVELDRSPLAQMRDSAPGEESDVRAFLHKFLFTGDNVNRPAGELSYGERARLSLALLVRRGANVLVLDEPLNHLDLDARERFEDALAQFDGTTIIVLHDRFAIKRLASRTLELRNGKLTERWTT